jgi:hypothetical protein
MGEKQQGETTAALNIFRWWGGTEPRAARLSQFIFFRVLSETKETRETK